MKKIIQITEENYNEIFLGNFQHKLKNKFIIFISKNSPKIVTIYYCFKQNHKNIDKLNHDIYGNFVRYQENIKYRNGINIYRYLDECRVFIF